MTEDDSGSRNLNIETGHSKLAVTAYSEELKYTGIVHLQVNLRSSDRRPSDLLSSMQHKYLILAQARIYERRSDELLQETGYVMLNMDRVESIFADELDE